MTRIRISIAVAALALAGLTAGLATAAATGKQTDRLSYRHVNAIDLDNTQGHVHISSGGNRGVTVERTTHTLFTHATNSAYLRNGVLHLRSRCHGTVCQVDYQINTPAGIRLQINEHNADASINGSPGNVAASTTGEGNLTLNLATAPRQLIASTHKGTITISVPRGPYAVIKKRTRRQQGAHRHHGRHARKPHHPRRRGFR
jgi:hypothetical protein